MSDEPDLPLVSVVLPTHNRLECLPRAIDSVLGQTYERLELIVVDDASEDATTDYLQRLGDRRVRWLSLETRGGAGRARNAGVRNATGDLIAFQDSDDEWLPFKLERQVRLLETNPDVGGVGGGYTIEGASGTTLYDFPALSRGERYEGEVLEGACCITPVWLFRRDVLIPSGLFDETMPSLEDWDLLLRLSRTTPLRCVFEPILVKRGGPNSIGWDIARRVPAMETLLERHEDRWRAVPRLYAEYCLELAYLNVLLGRRRAVRDYAARAVRSRGLRPTVLASFLYATAAARLWGGRGPLRRLSRDRHRRSLRSER
jgi:glycosyltransferase involved in cell wall biosynthesis